MTAPQSPAVDAELRECPFCGCVPVIWEQQRVICTHCECEGPDNETPLADNIAAWNTRPLEDALRAELAQVKAERDEALSVRAAGKILRPSLWDKMSKDKQFERFQDLEGQLALQWRQTGMREEMNEALAAELSEARASERERCAKVAEETVAEHGNRVALWLHRGDIAAAIRSLK